MTIVTSELVTNLEISMGEMLGVSTYDLPCIRLFDTRAGLLKYRMDEDITFDNIMKLINDWEKGTLSTYLKSDKLMMKEDGPITTIASKNFNEIVNDETRDVMVLFCNNVNEKCREFDSIYLYFAKKAKSHSNDTLLITYINNKLNELENYKILKVPAIKLFTGGNNQNVIDFYDEDFSYENLIDFVVKYSHFNNGFKKEDL